MINDQCPFPQQSPSLILAWVCHHHFLSGTSGFVPLLGLAFAHTEVPRKSTPSMGTLTVQCFPQPSTIAKEENCLCAFPPKTNEANLALNADGGRVAISLFNGFQKVTIYFSCKKLPFIGFREQQQGKQTIH